MLSVTPSNVRNTIHDRNAARNNSDVVTHCAAVSPMNFQPKPAISAPTSGAKRIMVSMVLALHHVDVFYVNRPAVTEETNKDRQTNRGLGGGNGQHEQREHLPHQIPKKAAGSRCIWWITFWRLISTR